MPTSDDPAPGAPGILRARAAHLRQLSGRIAGLGLGGLALHSGDEVWRGPLAERWRDELQGARRRLDACVDELRQNAAVLDRRADELDLLTAIDPAGLTGATPMSGPVIGSGPQR
jgi:hypothetical protein